MISDRVRGYVWLVHHSGKEKGELLIYVKTRKRYGESEELHAQGESAQKVVKKGEELRVNDGITQKVVKKTKELRLKGGIAQKVAMKIKELRVNIGIELKLVKKQDLCIKNH
ncbi:hypothetical protein P4U90_21625 [Cytobacillus kochii]|uniref:hypothetical protein n=1 Tax=Cytobacillus kochii TaxID=859143 RepID=UPI002E1E61E5|nr:hypothetical protein [Cytobacillus kochii]